MSKIIANDLTAFIGITERFDLLADLVVFRGQSRKGNLIPSIARTNPKTDTTEHEKITLEQLRLQGTPYLKDSTDSLLDLLVLAQHFGLKTRLLDWTSNPLAALWFACNEKQQGDVYVYALIADEFRQKDVYLKDPFETDLTKVFQPRLNNQRIVAQHGWFTLHRYSKSIGKFVAIENNKVAKQLLYEIEIPSESRQQMLKSLDRHGINRRTLFPDLEGLCLHLNWRYSL